MRKGIVPAFLLLLGSAVLGATVFHEPLAQAAARAQSVIVANDASSPVPVREQNLDGGNIRVHEEGTANVREQGTVAMFAAPIEPYQVNLDCFLNNAGVCTNQPAGQVPDGKRFVIETISASANADIGVTVTSFNITTATGGRFAGYEMLGTKVATDAFHSYSDAEARAVHLYADGGTSLNIGALASGSTSDGFVRITASGYLVPMP